MSFATPTSCTMTASMPALATPRMSCSATLSSSSNTSTFIVTYALRPRDLTYAITSASSSNVKLLARARALRLSKPKYTQSAPLSIAARSCGQPPAGASTSGLRETAPLVCASPRASLRASASRARSADSSRYLAPFRAPSLAAARARGARRRRKDAKSAGPVARWRGAFRVAPSPRDESVGGAVRAVVNIARARTCVDRGAREWDRGRGAEGGLGARVNAAAADADALDRRCALRCRTRARRCARESARRRV